MQVYGVNVRNSDGELKSEGRILSDYFNSIARECVKNTEGKTYDDLDLVEDRFNVFTNRLGFFERNLNYEISELLSEVTYRKHKEQLRELLDTDVILTYRDTDSPLDDCKGMVRELRKKLKRVIKIYDENVLKCGLVNGYCYYKQ